MSVLSVAEIANSIRSADAEYLQKAQQHTGRLVMPPRALGRMHDISERLCSIQRTLTPGTDNKAVLVFAGDHGVLEEGVSAFPQVVSKEMIRCFLKGGAGINALCRHVNAAVKVVDAGVASELDFPDVKGHEDLWEYKVAAGTANFARGPAMSKEQAQQSVQNGFEAASRLIASGVQIIGTGDMGIGNTTPAAAIGAVIANKSVESMVGRGSGVDDQGLQNKITAIEKGISVNRPKPEDALDVLGKVGGFEIGGIAGCILACAYNSIPVVIDGFISTAGAIVACKLNSDVPGYIFAGHTSEEPGHSHMLNHLGLQPILNLNMRLGEGTGGAMAMSIIDAAARMFREVHTFEQAGVSEE
ncbi:MAG: nicotinate-nucleotide--dimethylbenzimidazole phosphoribosyltransferase [Thermodesulfobacteriota bacterium]